MTHGSLFSGIGGFDLAAEWMGWTNLFNCEINPFCRTILKYHFPNAEQYADIRTVDFTVWRGRVDVLTGGFPCQPFSVAGKRKGTEDNRYLWPEMLRAIREIHPRWILGENVFGIISWSNGLVFEQVCSDLEVEGYEIQPFVLPACGVDAPHKRDRVWFVAHCSDTGTENMQRERGNGVHALGLVADTNSDRQRERTHQQIAVAGCKGTSYDCTCCEDGAVADTQCCGKREIYNEIQPQQPDGQRAYGNGDEQYAPNPHSKLSQSGDYSEQEGRNIKRKRVEPPYSPTCWADFPTQSPICSRNDGFPAGLDGITFPKWRNESIMGFGNAVVPQVVVKLFKVISIMNENQYHHQ